MVTIYHNPRCSASRNTLAMITASGETPEIIHYLETPLSRERLVTLMSMMKISPRELLRSKEAIFTELNLGEPSLHDDQLIDAMVAHPILINRPIVVTQKGARLCRPPEQVLGLLRQPVSHFTKEDGKIVYYSARQA
ncbi:arsenate reductase (glutaredoxin) [Vreelandella olivaria]|uniref:arsenate reductase (glutaredoxin) n=1 Tax=Vreelandella olivaria TaxID=390919 RepID=UPI00201EA5D1|nr:arsenate reductase (glutaredoxin) [Halomonas olivaria]